MTPEQLAMRDELNRMYRSEKESVKKERRLEYQRKYYQEHKQAMNEANKRWRERNPEAAKRIMENCILHRTERILAERAERGE